ncbi:hypothetical protein LX64_01796 [Chitinophaga skermanii]|uniref:Uncharacterized protein n=1 Tax=Chitinophaga skermanii TaxID=331697 RepID=A0A327QQ14_9BACT|nr:hypothetical protein [Chitinophaga skermanii]RAJ06669.1 hypothetical protein LX64_01796 [Chitinophaga skermanii]
MVREPKLQPTLQWTPPSEERPSRKMSRNEGLAFALMLNDFLAFYKKKFEKTYHQELTVIQPFLLHDEDILSVTLRYSTPKSFYIKRYEMPIQSIRQVIDEEGITLLFDAPQVKFYESDEGSLRYNRVAWTDRAHLMGRLSSKNQIVVKLARRLQAMQLAFLLEQQV